MEFKHNLTRLIIPLFIGLFLSACGSTPPQPDSSTQVQTKMAPPVLGKITHPAEFYFEQIKLSKGKNRITWQLLAARALIAEGHSQPAFEILQEVQRNKLNDQQHFEVALIKSEAYILEKRFQDAQSVLEMETDLAKSKTNHWHKFYLLKATLAEVLGDNAIAAEYRVTLNDFLTPEQQQTNNLKIWQVIKRLPIDQLEELAQTFQLDNAILSGWYQLAAIGNEFASDPQLLINNVQAWKNNYPEHPALLSLPDEMIIAMETIPYTPNQVAVLLPLTGKRGATGQAVREGIVSAYYEDDINKRVYLRFYDTAKKDAAEQYTQAINEGADFVIGPLLKDNLTKVLPLVSTVPLLSLNKLDDSPRQENVFYFSLTSNDEAAAAANKMHADGIKHPLVLAPANSIGERLAGIFSDQWESLTEERSDIYQYKSRKAMQQTVTALFSVDKSNERIGQIKTLLGSDLKTKSRSRRDIDAIYIIATPSEAMLAIPYIITTQNPYAPQVAVYASSRTYNSKLSRSQNKDLNGLIFSDMPWLLNPDRELKKQTLTLWPDMSKIEQNLFAMGYDSFKLIPNIMQLRNFPSLRLNGQTGILYVNDAGVVEREFTWAKYRSGKIRLQPNATKAAKSAP